ncbi:unnamed protein product [Amoebophrya sp. A25]|nr:unnamed protein product [Amoebophrya sp. A25]|eukprot:GSA25T00001752001.1
MAEQITELSALVQAAALDPELRRSLEAMIQQSGGAKQYADTIKKEHGQNKRPREGCAEPSPHGKRVAGADTGANDNAANSVGGSGLIDNRTRFEVPSASSGAVRCETSSPRRVFNNQGGASSSSSSALLGSRFHAAASSSSAACGPAAASSSFSALAFDAARVSNGAAACGYSLAASNNNHAAGAGAIQSGDESSDNEAAYSGDEEEPDQELMPANEDDGDDRNSWDGDGADARLLEDECTPPDADALWGPYDRKQNAVHVETLGQGRVGAGKNLLGKLRTADALDDRSRPAPDSTKMQFVAGLERHQLRVALLWRDFGAKKLLAYHRTGAGKTKSVLAILSANMRLKGPGILAVKNRAQKDVALRELLKWPSPLRTFVASVPDVEDFATACASPPPSHPARRSLHFSAAAASSSASSNNDSALASASNPFATNPFLRDLVARNQGLLPHQANIAAHAPSTSSSSGSSGSPARVHWRDFKDAEWDISWALAAGHTERDILSAVEKALELRGRVKNGELLPGEDRRMRKDMRQALATAPESLEHSKDAIDARLPAAPVRLYTYAELARALTNRKNRDAGLKFGQDGPNALNGCCVVVDEAHNLVVNADTDARQVPALKRLGNALKNTNAKTTVIFLTATPVVTNEAGQTDEKYLLNILHGEAFHRAARANEQHPCDEGFVTLYEDTAHMPRVKEHLLPKEKFDIFAEDSNEPAHIVPATLQGRSLAKYCLMQVKLQRAKGKDAIDDDLLLRWCSGEKQLTKHTRAPTLDPLTDQALAERYPKLYNVYDLLRTQAKEGKCAVLISRRAGLDDLARILEKRLPQARLFVYRDAKDSDGALSKFNAFSAANRDYTGAANGGRAIVNRSSSCYSSCGAGAASSSSSSTPLFPILIANVRFCSTSVTLKEVQNLHLVDVPQTWSDYRQLVGRARRFQSHKNLPPEKQYVRYFIHCAEMPFFTSEWKRVLYSTILLLKEPGGGSISASGDGEIEEAEAKRSKYERETATWAQRLREEDDVRNRAEFARKPIDTKTQIVESSGIFGPEHVKTFRKIFKPEDSTRLWRTKSKAVEPKLRTAARKKELWKEIRQQLRMREGAICDSLHEEDVDRILKGPGGRLPLRIPFQLHNVEPVLIEPSVLEKDPTLPPFACRLTWRKKPEHFPAKGLSVLTAQTADQSRLEKLRASKVDIETKQNFLKAKAIENAQ